MHYKSYSSHIKPKKKRWLKKHRSVVVLRTKTDYTNPYRTKTDRSKLRNRVTIFAFIITAIAWIGLLIFHPHFSIQKITIDGTVNIEKESIQEVLTTAISKKLLWTLPRNNFFILDEKKIQSILTTRFPIESLTIKKSFPHKLNVKIIERLAFVIYDDGQTYTLIDEYGVPQKTLRKVAVHEYKTEAGPTPQNPEEGSMTTSTIHHPDVTALQYQYGAYPIVHDKKQEGQLPQEVVQGIIKTYLFLNQNIDFATHHFIYPNEYQTIIAVNENGMSILLNPFENLNEQLETLKHAWQRELRKEKGKSVRINARYPSRVYIEE